MRLRTYSLALIAVAASLFLAIIAANLVADPEGVLGTGLFGPSPDPNYRYTRMRAYEAAPERYDGLLFGSSRTWSMPVDALSRWTDGTKFADFSLTSGSILDYLAVLEFVLRTKTAHGQALRSVFVLLDADLFGRLPIANRSIQTMWPPALTGESAWRFTWRYLTAIQVNAWRRQMGILQAGGAVRTSWLSAASAAEKPAVAPAPEDQAPPRERIVARPDFSRQLALLVRFVELCRTHRVTLAVALSPLNRSNAMRYDPDDLAEATARIAAVVPVWDFGAPEWLTARTDLWYDQGHFKPEVANMMLDRMFGGAASGAPPGFGVLRGN